MRTLSVVVLLGVIVPIPVGAQDRAALGGRWVREAAAGIGLQDIEPAWEDVTVAGDQVSVTRANRPEIIERYQADDTERAASRTVGEARFCRTTWDAQQLVTECRDARDGGPGGQTPVMYTREVRRVDARGRMVVETTWRSGAHVVTRTNVYRREQR